MAKDKGRDEAIDRATEERLSGGNDEALGWTKAFAGVGAAPTVPPLTPAEVAAFNTLQIRAKASGAEELATKLREAAADPARVREALAILGD